MQDTQAKDTPKHELKNQSDANTSRAGIPMLWSGNRLPVGNPDSKPDR